MALAMFLLFSVPTTIFSKACIDLTKEGGITVMLDAMWPTKMVIKNKVPITITESGYYHMLENVEGKIDIQADNVIVDLNGFTLSGDTAALITVGTETEDRYNILIKNGSLVGTTSERTNKGILIQDNASGIIIEDLHISNFDRGVSFEGTEPGTTMNGIFCSKVSNCFTTNCTTGYYLSFLYNSVFQENEVCSSEQFGFYLDHCMHNKFKHCMVVGVQNNAVGGTVEAEPLAVGYYTVAGKDNLFYESFVEGVQRGDGTVELDWCNKAIGFMFAIDPTTKEPETESKIVDCLVDTVRTTSWSNAFGIYLDMALNDAAVLEVAVPVAENTFEDDTLPNIIDVDWSPRCGYIGTAEDDGHYRVYKFAGTTIKEIADITPDDQPNAVAWSNDGRYLAAVTDYSGATAADFEIRVYDVDTNQEFTLNIDDDLLDVVWFHHAKKFVVVSDTTLYLFSFDPTQTGNEIVLLKSEVIVTNKRVVAITPDDKFIIVGQNNGVVTIYNLDLTQANLFTPPMGSLINSIDTNPVVCCGKYYIAVGYNEVSNKNLVVLEYDGSSTPEVLGDILVGGDDENVLSVKWHPTGKYLMVAPETGSEVYVYTFNPQQVPDVLTEYATMASAVPGEGLVTGPRFVDWSPCARYSIVAGCRTPKTTDPVTYLNIEIFPTGVSVSRCLVDHNKVANCSKSYVEGDYGEGLCAIGIFGGSACNCITRNIGYENCINFSQSVYNVFYNGLAGPHWPQGNWSIPPY